MSYVSGSTATPSGFDTQVPKPLPASAFGSTNTPAVRVVQDQGSSEIIINGMKSGSYFFASATASAGITLASGDAAGTLAGIGIKSVSTITFPGTSGSVGYGGSALTVPINANVWSGSGFAGAEGDVIFVYRGGL